MILGFRICTEYKGNIAGFTPALSFVVDKIKGELMIKVGDRFKTIRGEDYVVVKYENSQTVTVEFCDGHGYQVTTNAEYIRRGQIKNPYAPRIFEVGYFGVGNFKAKVGSPILGYNRTPEYARWMNMMSRCYDKNYINPHLYENVKVDDEWHCFQNFAEWYSHELKHEDQGWRVCMDKDIIGDGTVYSPSTCCFVPMHINSVIAKMQSGKFLPGVFASTTGLYGIIPGYGCTTDRFADEKTAHFAFLDAKSERIRSLAKEYKEFIREDVYSLLITKDFRYKFSPYFKNTQSS